MSSQVLRVGRFSTGTVDIHPQHAHRGRAPLYWWILTSRRWVTARPINVYVVEHSEGLVVFDTGQDRASVTDSRVLPGGPNRLDLPSAGEVSRLGGRNCDVRARAAWGTSHPTLPPPSSPTCTKTTSAASQSWRMPISSSPRMSGAPQPHHSLVRAVTSVPTSDVPGWFWEATEFPRLSGTALQPFTHGHDLFGDGSLGDPANFPDTRRGPEHLDVRSAAHSVLAAPRRRT